MLCTLNSICESRAFRLTHQKFTCRTLDDNKNTLSTKRHLKNLKNFKVTEKIIIGKFGSGKKVTLKNYEL